MAVKEVLKMGNPLLRQKARELSSEEIASKWFNELIRDMVETMHSEEGVGLAAPQIGESVRVSVIEFEGDNERYPDMGAQKLSVFVNPVIRVLDPDTEGFWEGCLSVPGLRGYVERPKKVSVSYLDENGKPKSLVADGFMAIVLQHEFDHLDGVLYIDRITDKTKIAYIEEYREFVLQNDDDQEV